MTGRVDWTVDERTYHSGPELSSTGARRILESPARYRWDIDHPVHKDAFDLGTAVHSAVLETGPHVIKLDFDNYRTKAAQEARDEAHADGFVPILAKDYAPIEAMREAVLAHPTARALFEQDGHSEASVYATDTDTGVAMRARYDYLPDLNPGTGTAVDLKTTGKEASAAGFAKSVLNFGYDVQQAFYDRALENATGQTLPFQFVVVETSAPHLVAVHELDIEWVAMGRAKVQRALEIFAKCTATNTWPGYPEDTQLLSPPAYAVYAHEDEYGALTPEIEIR